MEEKLEEKIETKEKKKIDFYHDSIKNRNDISVRSYTRKIINTRYYKPTHVLNFYSFFTFPFFLFSPPFYDLLINFDRRFSIKLRNIVIQYLNNSFNPHFQ